MAFVSVVAGAPSGVRAQMLMNPAATFPLAERLRSRDGIPLGEAFAFMSGLYFRGKLAYAEAFGHAPPGLSAVQVIVPGRGLVDARTPVRLRDLCAMAEVPVEVENLRYRRPLLASVRRLAKALPESAHVVLLGSIATGKYLDILREGLAARLYVPTEFAGRGDMSRGGLMLRCVRAGIPLTYIHHAAAPRHAKRPPRLERWRAGKHLESAVRDSPGGDSEAKGS